MYSLPTYRSHVNSKYQVTGFEPEFTDNRSDRFAHCARITITG